MAERKKTPDILADLLGTSLNAGNLPVDMEPDGDLTAKQQNIKTESQKNSESSKQKTGKTVRHLVSTLEQEEAGEEQTSRDTENKIKVTFYLSEDTVDLFEDAQLTLRRLGRSQGSTTSKSATSKSALLEEALKLICSDIQSNGLNSQLARKMF